MATLHWSGLGQAKQQIKSKKFKSMCTAGPSTGAIFTQAIVRELDQTWSI